MNTDVQILRECPFCGWKPPMDNLLDVLHPSGTVWRYRALGDKIVVRSYHSLKDHRDGDEYCWELNCNESMGGCGAEMHADSKEEVIQKWNRRLNDDEVQED